MNIKFLFFLIFLFLLPLFLACSEKADSVLEPKDCPETRTVTEIVHVPIVPEKPFGFRPDFTIVVGVHDTGQDAYESLQEGNFRVSNWSAEALTNPHFPMSQERRVVNAVVVSLLELGFTEDDFVSMDMIISKGKELGLLLMTPEMAVAAREQFIAQPDYSTGDRLGEFFVAMEGINLFNDGVRKIFSIVRDDEYPHQDTEFGFWLISNNIENAGQPRLFNSEKENDFGGRFVWVLPDEINLDVLDFFEEQKEE